MATTRTANATGAPHDPTLRRARPRRARPGALRNFGRGSLRVRRSTTLWSAREPGRCRRPRSRRSPPSSTPPVPGALELHRVGGCLRVTGAVLPEGRRGNSRRGVRAALLREPLLEVAPPLGRADLRAKDVSGFVRMGEPRRLHRGRAAILSARPMDGPTRVELKPSSQGVDALAEALRATYVQNGVPVDWDRA